MKTIRIGIAGTGKIVPESAASMLETGYELVSIWGPHPEKAVPLAARFSIPKVCGSYEELLSSGIDFVYIALVNSVHYEYALTALRAGVNVFVEKPFCSNARQAEELASLARSKGLFLLETISNVYQPSWLLVKERLHEIGAVKLFRADYSQYSSRYDAYLRGEVSPSFDPAFEGGALRDLNIYNLHLAIDILGSPEEVVFRANRGYNGIDTSGAVMLRYPDAIAICSAAKDSENPSGVVIQGDKGFIKADGAPNILSSVDICIRGKAPEHYEPNRYTSRLSHQYENFRDIYLRVDYDAMLATLSHTLLVMGLLDRCEE